MYFGSDGTGVPSVKRYLKEMDGMVPWTWWSHQDVGHSQDGLKAVMQLFGREEAFMTAKPPALIERILRIATNGGDLVLDYFAGSGTTGHAVINLNREDGGTRKFILVEMGEYFDTVLTPRITKALYSPDWKDGHAQSHDKGVSALVKILKLESYEDTLNNLAITTGEGAAKQTDLFAELNAAGQSRVAEEYLLGYSLDMETKDGLLRTKDFAKPFGYALRTYDRTTGDRDAVMYADLPETFNALLGLRVILRRLDRDILRIEGTNRQGERILILWRDCTVADCAKLAAYAEKLDLNPADTEFTAIYVNGDHTLHDPHKKIHRIEKTFAELMFEGCDE